MPIYEFEEYIKLLNKYFEEKAKAIKNSMIGNNVGVRESAF